MSWISPLGFLGFLSLLVLLLIYLLKPNYQQKFISSTFVWKLSLKYKKKSLPVSKLRNILLIICQVLIITACTLIFAGPIVRHDAEGNKPEKIIIIDASVSMRTTLKQDNGAKETRFERAVAEAMELTFDVLEEEGTVTLIVADNDVKDTVFTRCSSVDQLEALFVEGEEEEESALALTKEELTLAFKKKLNEMHLQNYGTADIEGAMELAEEVLLVNPKSEVLFYTGSEYIEKGFVNVINVAKRVDENGDEVWNEGEWNAGILNCETKMVDNLFVFEVQVACYNKVEQLKVYLEIDGANTPEEGEEPLKYEVYQTINPEENTIEIVTFDVEFWNEFRDTDSDPAFWVYAFDEAYIYIETATGGGDSFSYDDSFQIFGGRKQALDFQYYSAATNPFYDIVLSTFIEISRNSWDINLDTLENEEPKLEKCDFYLFESVAMDYIPEDGIVFISDPKRLPRDLELELGSSRTPTNNEATLTIGKEHAITKYITADNIAVRKYTPVEWYDPEVFTPLLYCEGSPVMLVKNEPNSKVIVFTGDIHFSTLAVNVEFPIMMYNIMEYFFPATLEKHVYEVGETVKLNARGENLELVKPDKGREVFEKKDLPKDYVLPVSMKGFYVVSQMLMDGELLEEYFYVKIPASESNICKQIDELKNPYRELPDEDEELAIKDLIPYFLMAWIALMFIEWWLQSRENM